MAVVPNGGVHVKHKVQYVFSAALGTGGGQASQELVTKAAYFLPLFKQADGLCEVTCNTQEVDTASISATSEPKTCVGTLQVRSCSASSVGSFQRVWQQCNVSISSGV